MPEAVLKRVLLAAVGVNKAADYYMSAEEEVSPSAPLTKTSVDEDDIPEPRGRQSRSASKKRVRTTLDRLREKEAELDVALGRSYERFCRGAITAKEMDSEREQLIRVFNQRVMSENIRYRSMMRNHSGIARRGRLTPS